LFEEFVPPFVAPFVVEFGGTFPPFVGGFPQADASNSPNAINQYFMALPRRVEARIRAARSPFNVRPKSSVI
jgi:hypothetical protein